MIQLIYKNNKYNPIQIRKPNPTPVKSPSNKVSKYSWILNLFKGNPDQWIWLILEYKT